MGWPLASGKKGGDLGTRLRRSSNGLKRGSSKKKKDPPLQNQTRKDGAPDGEGQSQNRCMALGCPTLRGSLKSSEKNSARPRFAMPSFRAR